MAAITEENLGRYLFLYRTEAVPKNISVLRIFVCCRLVIPFRYSKNGVKYEEYFFMAQENKTEDSACSGGLGIRSTPS